MSLALYLYAQDAKAVRALEAALEHCQARAAELRARDRSGDFDGTLDYQEAAERDNARRARLELELCLDDETAARDPGDPHELADAQDDEFGDRFLDDGEGCSNPGGHVWNRTAGEADEARLAGDFENDNIRCVYCGADGDA